MKEIIEGTIKFRLEVLPQLSEMFDRLAIAQSPEVLFITCSDSRIDPNLITQANPGRLFICRNAGNIVPPHQYHAGGMTASIEYAVQALKIKDIIICGHYGCGAMAAAMDLDAIKDFPHVLDWLVHSRAAMAVVDHTHPDASPERRLDMLCERNIVLQMQHLATHPYIAARLATDEVELHGWIYDIGSGMIKAYDSNSNSFIPVEEHYAGTVHLTDKPNTVAGA
ncbi:MAG: carbonic anhydrase [Gammaproteobacteria bacterium]|nr:carbonic anhydrase [Gammaproteobacteria bacterium]